tara:strand:+ start:424 stop:690 length:267 start_codon:yes stop_codon:yes gene_type:complete
MNLLARFKAATGLSDQQIADLIGRPRSTVQSVVAGRAPDTTPPAAILPTVSARAVLLADLADDLHKMNVDILAALLDSDPTNHGDNTQ